MRDFRNSFEHSSRDAMIDVRYTKLGSVPAHANLADAMEAMAICANACAVLRHVVAGLDLMPQCLVPSQQHTFFVGLDRLADEAIFPLYSQVVAALGLTTDLAPYSAPHPLRGQSLVQAGMAIKHQVSQADVRLDAPPADMWLSFEAFTTELPGVPSPEAFGIPGYMRQRAHQRAAG